MRLGMQRQQGTCLVDDAHGRKPHHCLLLLCKGRRGRGPTRRLSCMLWCSRGGGRLLVLLQGEIHRFRGLQVPLAQRRGDGICEESGEERGGKHLGGQGQARRRGMTMASDDKR